jgi:hypothetical protein
MPRAARVCRSDQNDPIADIPLLPGAQFRQSCGSAVTLVVPLLEAPQRTWKDPLRDEGGSDS